MGFLRGFLLSIEPGLAKYETEILIALSVSLLLVVLVVFWLCFSGRSKGHTICLLGLSDSGKTLLYLRLTGSEYLRTQNSIKENRTEFTPSGKDTPLSLVDVPGNERIRDSVFRKYKDTLKAIVLVIDSFNFPQEARSVAELCFDLLSDRMIHKRRVAILVACNKQDLALVSGRDYIKKRLEAEITALKTTRAAKLDSIDGGPKNQAPVSFGKNGKDFEFSDLSLSVSFVDCSARGKGEESSCTGEVEKVQEWLAKLS